MVVSLRKRNWLHTLVFRQESVLPDIFRSDQHVFAHESVDWQLRGEEGRVHVVEELFVASDCVSVQAVYHTHGLKFLVVEWVVMEIPANQSVAEIDVFFGVQDVGVPERIDHI